MDENNLKTNNLRQYYREYYQKNKDRILEKQRLWRENNKNLIVKPAGALMRKREKIKKNHEKLQKKAIEFKANLNEK